MKIAVISDIHIDINEEFPVIQKLADQLCKNQADAVLIAGDICENGKRVREAMEDLEQRAGIPVWYVAGNHDMWSTDFEALSTEQIYADYVADARCLCQKSVVLQGNSGPFLLTGDIGWYEYSFASPEFSKEELDKMTYSGRTWQDKLKNQWTDDNISCMKRMLNHLETQLSKHPDMPAIVVTHMLPIREFCVPEEREIWKYFNAFLGGESLEELYQKYPVRYAVCGHVHYRKQITKGDITYFCPCLGYHTEWNAFYESEEQENENKKNYNDVEEQIEAAMQWIEL